MLTSVRMQGAAPEAALLEWTNLTKRLEATFVIIFTNRDFNAASGTGQGRMRFPAAQTLIKNEFNYHAVRAKYDHCLRFLHSRGRCTLSRSTCSRTFNVRSSGRRRVSKSQSCFSGILCASNSVFSCFADRENQLSGPNLIDFYAAVVLALARGELMTYALAQSKPYIRNSKSALDHSASLKVIEDERRTTALENLVKEHPHNLT